MIEIRNVSRRFGEFRALDGVSLTIEPGKTTVLIGPSGCGKSTLIRTLIGLIAPDDGGVYFNEQLVTADNALAIRQRTGYVIQSGGLFPHLSARENVLLMTRYLKRDLAAASTRLTELAQLTHLDPSLLDRYPAQLSGGQRQRVSLMRALMLDPEALLLDEPLGALDPLIRAELQRDLRDIFRTLGKTVVMVTHDMGEAAWFGDTIALMRAGKIVQQGRIEDLLKRPADPYVTDFINAQRSPLDVVNGGVA
ncbi:MAG: ATP-binding cassette domain-containing protein [Planctomycetota bacterium]